MGIRSDQPGGIVAPSSDTEFSQVYLYEEDITDCDAFVEIVADEEANGAELVDVTLTTMPTRGNESVGSECGEQVMVLTFRHNPAEQHAQEVGCRWADRWVAPWPNGAQASRGWDWCGVDSRPTPALW